MTENNNAEEATMKTKTKSRHRAERIAELIEEQEALRAEEAEHDKVVAEAIKRAGHARCAAVEELYEVLGIAEQTTQRTAKDGTVTTVRSDRDETKRAALLVEAVLALVERATVYDEKATEPGGHESEGTEELKAEGDDDIDVVEEVDPHERGFEAAFGR